MKNNAGSADVSGWNEVEVITRAWCTKIHVSKITLVRQEPASEVSRMRHDVTRRSCCCRMIGAVTIGERPHLSVLDLSSHNLRPPQLETAAQRFRLGQPTPDQLQ